MNVQGRENLSVKKTNRQLKRAIIELMQQKSYSRITVSELTACAEVSKSTFYLHYHDIKDLVDCVRDEFINEVAESIQALTDFGKSTGNVVSCNDFIGILERNRPLCLALSRENADVDFYEMLLSKIRNTTLNTLSSEYDTVYNKNLTMDFLISGVFGYYFESVKKDRPVDSHVIAQIAITYAVALFKAKDKPECN